MNQEDRMSKREEKEKEKKEEQKWEEKKSSKEKKVIVTLEMSRGGVEVFSVGESFHYRDAFPSSPAGMRPFTKSLPVHPEALPFIHTEAFYGLSSKGVGGLGFLKVSI